jgi:hypothetical protein
MKKLSKDDINDFLTKENRGIFLVGEYTDSKTKTTFQCLEGHTWDVIPDNVKRGSGCPHCADYGFNPSKSAVVYGFTRDNYLKVGITNNLEQRLWQHRKYGEINLVYERHYPVGQDAQIFERNFKQTHGGNYVTKEVCPDGHTETFPLHLLEELIR